MKELLENCLGLEVHIEELNTRDTLPMLYNSLYEFMEVKTENISWVIAVPKEQINLSQIRKHHRQMEKLLEKHCVIYFEKTSVYSKNTMVSERIPFIIDDREIYLPFLGILLNTSNERTIKPVQHISFLTQKMLIQAIYENWHKVNATNAAKKLEITRMSASRCFDEIEFFDIPILDVNGKSRVINIQEDKRELWNDIKPILRNPVTSSFLMIDDLRLPIQGGMSALSEYSMIEDNRYKTYVVSKKDIGEFRRNNYRLAAKGEMPECLVQEVGYLVKFKDGKNVDPLTLSLSLSDVELADERVEKSVREMLEKYVW